MTTNDEQETTIKIPHSIPQQKLRDLEFEHIHTWDDLNKIISFYVFDRYGTPMILTEHKSVILFDNTDFNKAFLLDSFKEAWDKFNQTLLNERHYIKRYYINDLDIRMRIFQPSLIKFYYLEQKTDMFVEKVERELLSPTIFLINPVMQQIVKFNDQFDIFGDRNPQKLLKYFNWLFSEKRPVIIPSHGKDF
jgi:hypothetical protein